VKLEQARGTRARRYVFHFDEVAAAEAQGLPCILVPRLLSTQEWMEEYGGGQPAIEVSATDLIVPASDASAD
jgi:hypothetical protein